MVRLRRRSRDQPGRRDQPARRRHHPGDQLGAEGGRAARRAGISSLDWERYPVIKFSEVPEIFCELVDPLSDNPPLGIGEATGGPTVAAIGNAVAQALGTRLRDLPMTRERVMAALLKA